jgi:hypothetical protein
VKRVPLLHLITQTFARFYEIGEDPLAVCGIEGICDLNSEVENRFDFQRSTCDLVLKTLAFEILHGDEGLAFMRCILPSRPENTAETTVLGTSKVWPLAN